MAKVTFGEWAADWLRTTVHLKPKTIEGYESLLRKHLLPAFEDVPLGHIRQLDVREWVSGLSATGLSPSRTGQGYRLLGAILRSAVESGHIPKSPAFGIDLPRIQMNEMRFLREDEVDHLAETITAPYETLVYLLAYGGCRWGEATALRRSRCDLLRTRLEIAESVSDVSGQLHFGPTKTYRRRTIVLPQFLVNKLAAHIATHVGPGPDALIFTTPDGSPLRNGNFNKRIWRPAIEQAGVAPLTIHDLRHTAASLLISEGAHPKAIQVHLGHSSIAVTMDRYGHLFPSDQEDLAARLDARYEAAQVSHVDKLWTEGSLAVSPLSG